VPQNTGAGELALSSRAMRRPVVLVLGVLLALAVSGCAGTAAGHPATGNPTTIVRQDLSPISRAFPGWPEVPNDGAPSPNRCTDLAERTVFATIEYRSPGNSRSHVAAYATPKQLQCLHPLVVKFWRRFYHPYVAPRICLSNGGCLHRPARFTRCCTVRTTAGLPHSLSAALGPRARGFRQKIIPLRYFQNVYELTLVYQSASDPHVV